MMDIVHDPKTGKREMIEGALGRFFKKIWLIDDVPNVCIDFDALAEQAIVMPIRVRHIVSGQIGKPERTVEITKISLGYEHPERGWIDMPTEEIGGHHGTPGKALAIILPDRASIEDSRTDSASMEEEEDETH